MLNTNNTETAANGDFTDYLQIEGIDPEFKRAYSVMITTFATLTGQGLPDRARLAKIQSERGYELLANPELMQRMLKEVTPPGHLQTLCDLGPGVALGRLFAALDFEKAHG